MVLVEVDVVVQEENAVEELALEEVEEMNVDEVLDEEQEVLLEVAPVEDQLST